MQKKIIVLLLACVAFFSHNTALRPDIMECRNLVTAREIASGDCSWLLPTMNGALRLEKPMLPTWIAAVVECVSPDNLALQRVPPALAALLWVLFLYLFVKRLTDEDTALITTLVFITCYQVVLMGRTATWDVYCHAFMTGALFFLHRLLCPFKEEKSAPWRDAAIAGLLLGLSFLSKGPVSFFGLLLPFFIALPLLPNFSLRGKWKHILFSLVLCLVLGGWWYAYLHLVHPTELASVLDKETGAWTNRNVRPWWYYWRFWVEAGIWAPFVLLGLALPYWKKRISAPKTYLFIFTFMVAQVVLLSLMPEKKFRYLLPMMPTMAMMTGLLLSYYRNAGYKWVKRMLVIVVSVVVVVELLAFPYIGRLFTGEQANTLVLLRHDERTNGLPYYHASDQELRIESVYNAGRRVMPINLSDTAAVRKAMPFVLLTHTGTTDSLLSQLPPSLQKSRLGMYDDNHHNPSDKHYNPAMCHDATVIRNK